MMLRKLKIGGFKEFSPNVNFTEYCTTWSLEHCPHPGSDAEFLQMALEIANIEYETVQKDLNTTDLIVDCIENGTIDMSILAIRITEDRFDRISYTTPINFLKFGYLIRDTEKLESDDFLLHTFRPEIYPLLLAGLLVTAFAVRFLCHSDSGFFTWIWRLFILFFNQDHFFFNPKLKTMFVGGSWIIFAFLVVSYYQVSLMMVLNFKLCSGQNEELSNRSSPRRSSIQHTSTRSGQNRLRRVDRSLHQQWIRTLAILRGPASMCTSPAFNFERIARCVQHAPRKEKLRWILRRQH
ncbi:hypothetical protein L596_018087 [Steinernema carpocapsae]|uniref:Solute-binding protein family 3/N-terminal domain-containing protein n=1 Tax=Steinernema carpocapsae TaxID=34508 RepID=A0A4U5N3X3_STECR|nr:hypothetical protein L596_018087 [Steinernema carpocapsae]